MPTRILVSCEHATNRVPAAYRALFHRAQKRLQSHRGHDPGALEFARMLARTLDAELLAGRATRLLVDLNRHANPAAPLSELTRVLPPEERATLLARHHAPYRDRAVTFVEHALSLDDPVVHLSCHSFTPRLGGRTRTADVGLLYDPRRPGEVRIVSRWQAAIAQEAPALRTRRNYPYRGVSDGLTQFLRRRTPPERYAGIEIELNQRLLRGSATRWRAILRMLCRTAKEALHADQNVPR
jgi:predicted N-formylglutamate amidohydrolase